MAQHVFRITAPGTNGQGKAIFYNFEPAVGYHSLASLVAELEAGKIVTGFALVTEHDPDARANVFRVVARKPFALTKGGVGAIEIPRMRFEEA